MKQDVRAQREPHFARGEPPGPAHESARWNWATRVAFRFGFVYFGLYNSELVLHLFRFPPFSQIDSFYESLRWNLVVWVGKQVLHLRHDFSTDFHNLAGGSKDTTYVYVQILCYLAISLVATVIWSLCDRRRSEYVRLHAWFLLSLRLCLSATLISYGVPKLLPVQFPPPSLSQLVSIYGDSTRRTLLWISMGISPVYSFFGGAMEVIPGLLLVIPRLVTLGALLSTATMVNVLMLNFGYDVAVKSLVLNLVGMGLIILLPDMARLTNYFVLNGSVAPAPDRPLFRKIWLNRAALILQIAFGFAVFGNDLHTCRRIVADDKAASRAPLYGIWDVDEYVINGESRPPLGNNPHRWQRLVVNLNDDVVVQVMTGQFNHLYPHLAPQSHRLVLTQPENPGWIAEFTYQESPPGSLVLQGKMAGLPVQVRLHREDESKFPLTDHSIHWVSDNN